MHGEHASHDKKSAGDYHGHSKIVTKSQTDKKNNLPNAEDDVCLHCSSAATDIQVRCDECSSYICTACHWCHEYQANHEIRVCDRCDAFYCRGCDEMDQCDDCGEVVCASCSTLLSCKFCGGGLCEDCATACGRYVSEIERGNFYVKWLLQRNFDLVDVAAMLRSFCVKIMCLVYLVVQAVPYHSHAFSMTDVVLFCVVGMPNLQLTAIRVD